MLGMQVWRARARLQQLCGRLVPVLISGPCLPMQLGMRHNAWCAGLAGTGRALATTWASDGCARAAGSASTRTTVTVMTMAAMTTVAAIITAAAMMTAATNSSQAPPLPGPPLRHGPPPRRTYMMTAATVSSGPPHRHGPPPQATTMMTATVMSSGRPAPPPDPPQVQHGRRPHLGRRTRTGAATSRAGRCHQREPLPCPGSSCEAQDIAKTLLISHAVP